MIAKGDVDSVPRANSITPDGRIFLGPQEKIMMVFKFLTYREVTLNKDSEPSKSMIHSRRITIRIQSNGSEY